MGPEPAAFQMGLDPRAAGTGSRDGRQLRAGVEYRPGETCAPENGSLYYRDRSGRSRHCFRRNLMSIGLSDAALAPHLLFRGMSAGERQELLGMFETTTFEPGAMILAEEESYQIL